MGEGKRLEIFVRAAEIALIQNGFRRKNGKKNRFTCIFFFEKE